MSRTCYISVKFVDAITADGRITLDELAAITSETAEEFVELSVTGALFFSILFINRSPNRSTGR